MVVSLKVTRDSPSSIATCGTMTGHFQCYTLEPAYKQTPTKPRCTPAGTYMLTVRWSPKFNALVPHVEGVPDFEQVELHWGNLPRNTDGCTLVGSVRGPNYVGQSRDTWMRLMQLLVPGVDPHDVKNKNLVMQVGSIEYVDVS